ncbi:MULTISPECIES: hypothetical protein [Pseudomonas]|uniref:Uncharacterized protein n=1 Tax=Pseudomonas syringae pv. papulans TaxID=83963 RepID=A0A0P9Y3C0_PSESX|nr:MULTISPECIES: hypothetical protein [Pseudomonas]EXL31046.1 Prophage PssSM-01, Orf22 [Pseudomonas syringae pv. syringae str. B301D-R]KPY26855.1 hypothetical protein ALO65_200272 [Pseudomonas syringae pv. papulans]KWS20282.1 hypothetical protein AL064_20375 [Pseudomonas syringae pv. syringae]KWS39531.1 hypothetical protein AL059_25370 [Pseudomonas syringae pv. papulans]MDH4606656.1 hypothetical protein [Pseudomonas syringae pv. papulans]
MDDIGKKIIYLEEKLRERELAIKRQQYLKEKKLRQAHTLALISLETNGDLHPDVVLAALKIADRYMSTLRGCVQVLGGSDLRTTATFPEGEVDIDNLSQ